MNNKYIEYIDNQLILREPVQVERVKLLSQINDSLLIRPQVISLRNRVYRFTWNKNSSNFYIDYLKCSGVKNVNNKRLQIPVNSNAENMKGLPIGIYYCDKGSCYVLFDNLELSINNSSSNRSLWVDFVYIYAVLKNKKNLKYKCVQKNTNTFYWVYISTDISLIISKMFNYFEELSDREISKLKSEIDNFVKIQNNNILSDEINSSIFSKKFEDKTSFNKFHANDEEIGRIGEQLFFDLLKNNDKLMLNELKIEHINKFIWTNEHGESFKPFDFLVNENIYIDVKATTYTESYFVLSDNEHRFKQEINMSKNKYFVVNIANILDRDNLKWYVFNSEQIDGFNCIEKTERIYGDKYGKK